MQKAILVTNFDDTGEDVMIFTSSLTPEKVEETLLNKGKKFTEVYEVKESEIQYYCFEPCYFD